MSNQLIKLIAFDLDDTLYDANLYAQSAFKVIAEFLAKGTIDDLPANIEKKLWKIKEEKGSLYKKLFDDLLFAYGIQDKDLVIKIVALFHRAPLLDNFRPHNDVLEVLNKLKGKYDLAIATHGQAKNQKRVLKALGIWNNFKFLLSARDEGIDKVNKKFFSRLIEKGYQPNEIIYIGNNPLTDFIGPKKLGIQTVRLLRGEFAKLKVKSDMDADYYIKDFSKLLKILRIE